MDTVLQWCAAVLGPFEVAADATRAHPGERTGSCRIRTQTGDCYVKMQRDRSFWEGEVHAYERWAQAFGEAAPRLLAVREEEPLAVVISALPGRVLEGRQLPLAQERAAWRAAGQALVALHDLAVGECFGPVHRDGRCAGAPIREAEEFVLAYLEEWEARGLAADCLSADERATLRAARTLVPAFAGERPRPCHRDYCPANWLINDEEAWSGVIDFEFSQWDVRATDFSRYANWEWLGRPDLIEAFFEGYGRAFTPAEEQQRLLAHTQYALSAIVWGHETGYLGFAREGRESLQHLRTLLE
jgi:aminoglycoside phosphotransferase (APT) family kinase protein